MLSSRQALRSNGASSLKRLWGSAGWSFSKGKLSSNQNLAPCSLASKPSSLLLLKEQWQPQQKRNFASAAASVGSGEKALSAAKGSKPSKTIKKPKIVSASSTGAKSKKARAESNALHRAAQEADRLSQLARSSPHKPKEDEKSKKGKNPGPSWAEDTYEIRVGEAMNAATALLRISKIRTLGNAILHQDDPERVAKVHRAFISVLSWGITLVEEGNSNELLEKLLSVTDQCHKLDLPLHIPLYKQLIEQIAVNSKNLGEKRDSVGILFDLTLKGAEHLNDEEIFEQFVGPVLQQLLLHPNNREAPELDRVDRFLDRISDNDVVDLANMPFSAIVSVLVGVLLSVRSGLSDASKRLYVDEAASIVNWMEPAMTKVIDEFLMDDDDDDDWSTQSIMSDHTSDFEPDSFEIIIQSILTRDLPERSRAKILITTMLKALASTKPSLPSAFSIPTRRSGEPERDNPDFALNEGFDDDFLDDDDLAPALPDVTAQFAEWIGDGTSSLRYSPELKAAITRVEESDVDEGEDPSGDSDVPFPMSDDYGDDDDDSDDDNDMF